MYTWYTFTQLEKMMGTREQILKTILNKPRCTINELAQYIGINPISIRHHITHLMVEGLVDAVDERHGVGRPRRAYTLTEAGLEHFPTRYIKLTSRLLKLLKENLSQDQVQELFTQMAENLADEMSAERKLEGLSIEDKLDVMGQFLRLEGFHISWEKIGDTYYIHESSCPYYHIGQNHPEVCSVDEIIISTLLSHSTSKTKCILNGDSTCTFEISKKYNS